MAADLSGLDLLVIQIDGIHIDQDLILLGVTEGASESAAVCQALIDHLVGRRLDPAICRLFIVDGSRALLKSIRASFGRNTPIQRRQIHKARNVKRWRDAATIEAAKGFRRIKAHKQFPSLRAALLAHQASASGGDLDPARKAAQPHQRVPLAEPFSTSGGTSPPRASVIGT
ncbi:transposase-like protein [Rhodoblastus sphagnicola]|nr:transposase-like protein [Rhodoblastus sphagnicola]